MKFNGQDIHKVKLNGVSIDKIRLNGTPCWSKEDKKLYSFGVLSDVHIYTGAGDATYSINDFSNAVRYFRNYGCSMLCISGDITQMGTDADFNKYIEIRDANKGNMKVFEITGNHEASSSRKYKSNINDANCIAYHIYNLVGNHFCYFVENGKVTYWDISLESHNTTDAHNVEVLDDSIILPENDAYIFVGILGDANGNIFFTELFQWIYNTLEHLKMKRCFLFEHCRAERLKYNSIEKRYDKDLYASYVSGNAGQKYLKSLWSQADNKNISGLMAYTFESLLSNYTNCIWFHGHTHFVAESETREDVPNSLISNVDTYFGDAYNVNDLTSSANNTKWTWSVHVPSCAYPRVYADNAEYTFEADGRSQGIVVDVYKNRVVLKYIDFAKVIDGSITYVNNQILEKQLDTKFDEIQNFIPPVVNIGGIPTSLVKVN